MECDEDSCLGRIISRQADYLDQVDYESFILLFPGDHELPLLAVGRPWADGMVLTGRVM